MNPSHSWPGISIRRYERAGKHNAAEAKDDMQQ
jgi:hypothetical protein